jgi:hypothetical protein
MSKHKTGFIGILAVLVVMAALNLINIPRGTQLHCYKNLDTTITREASYGFPFTAIKGNTSYDSCSIEDSQFGFLEYNKYSFHLTAVVANVTLAILVAVLTYALIAKYNATPKPVVRKGKL